MRNVTRTIRSGGINLEDKLAVYGALSAVNGRAHKFTLTATDVTAIAARATKRLDRAGLPLAMRKGITVSYTPPGPAARAYGNMAAATKITLEYKATGWRLMAAERVYVGPCQKEQFHLQVTGAVAAEISRRAVVDLHISEKSAPCVAAAKEVANG